MIFSVESIKRWLASMKASSRRRKAKARRQPTTLQIENLEPRHLMAVDQTVDDAQAAFSLVGDWTTVSDSSSVGTAYHQFAGGTGSTGEATWTFSDLEVGKHYEFLTTWADDATGSAAYSILDGGAVDASRTLDQSKDVLPAVAGETGWRSLGVVTADHTALSVKLTASSGITADAVRIVEVTGGMIRELDPGERKTATAVRPDGSYVVVWEAFGDETWGGPGATYAHDVYGSSGIVAQIVSAGGVKLSSAFLVNQYTTYDQSNPTVEVAADGGFVIAWSSWAQYEAQSGDGSGAGSGSGGGSGNGSGSGSGSGSGGGSGSSSSSGPVPTMHVYARRFDAFGAARDDEFEVSRGDGQSIDVAIAADGSFVVVGTYWEPTTATSWPQPGGGWGAPDGWGTGFGDGVGSGSGWFSSSGSGFAYNLFARRYDAAGEAFEWRNVSGELTKSFNPEVKALPNGTFVVTWDAIGANWIGYASIATLDLAGVPSAPAVIMDGAYGATQPTLAAASNGDFLVVYSQGASITAQRFSSGGPSQPAENHPVPDAWPTDFALTKIDGGWLLVRQAWDAYPNNEVWVEALDSNGRAPVKAFRVGAPAAYKRTEPEVGTDASGAATIFWTQFSNNASERGVFARRLDSYSFTNAAPTTSGIPNLTVNEDAAASVDLFAAFDDAMNYDRDLTYAVVANSNTALVTSTSLRLADGRLDLNVPAHAAGTASITIRATDKQGLYVESQFQFKVNAKADAPIVSIFPIVDPAGKDMALTITAALRDVDGSETLGDVFLTGAPAGAALSAGTDQGGGKWKLAAADLSGLTLSLPEDFDTPFKLTVSVKSKENSTGEEAETAVTTNFIRPAVAAPAAWVVDDADAGFTLGGDWSTTTDASAVAGGVHQYLGGPGDSGWAKWTFSNLESGKLYELFVAWPDGGTEEVVYEVLAGSTSQGTVHADQASTSNDRIVDGVHWKSLGVHRAGGTELSVRLAADGGAGVLADAVRIAPVQSAVVGENVGDVAVRPDGSFVVVSGQFVQVFDSHGNALAPPTSLYQDGMWGQSDFEVAAGPNGEFAVIWTSLIPRTDGVGQGAGSSSGSGYGWNGQPASMGGLYVYGRQFDPTGVVVGGVFEVGHVHYTGATLAYDSTGALLILGDAQDYYQQLFTYTPGGYQQPLGWYTGWNSTTLEGRIGEGFVVGAGYGSGAGSGGFVVPSPSGAIASAYDGGWLVANTIGTSGIQVDRYDSAGAAEGGWTLSIPSVWYYNPAVEALADGGFILAWQAPDGSGLGIYSQRFDAQGRAVGAAFRAHANVEGNQTSPELATLSTGDVALTWISYASDPLDYGVRALVFAGASLSSNSAPTASDGYLSLSEDQTDGAADVFALFADDHDDDSTLYYEVVENGGIAFASAWIDSGNGLLYVAPAADESGSGWVRVRATDSEGLSSEATVWIDVAAVADVPQLSVSPGSGDEDAEIAISISAWAVDGSESVAQVTISGVPTGAVLSAGESLGDGVWKVAVGTLANLTLTAPANFHGDFDLTISATSVEAANGDSETVEQTLSVSVASVDDLTTLSAPASLSAAEDVAKAVSGLILQDVDGADSAFEVLLSVENGTLTLSGTTGLTFVGDTASGEAVLRFTGSFADVNAALATLKYRGDADYSGEDAIQVEVHALDSEGEVGELIGTAEVAVTVAPVADAPNLTVGDAEGDEDAAIAVTISSGLVDTDGSETLQDVLISGVPSGATLSAGTSLGDGVWRVSLAQLSGLKITPAANFHGIFDLTVKTTAVESANDDAAHTSKTLSVVVASVDDLTTLSVPAALAAVEDVSKAVAGLVLADVDAADGTYKITLSVAHGTLSLGETSDLSFLEDTASGDAELVFSGTFVAVNAALATLAYLGSANYSGEDAIHVEAVKLGEEGEEDVDLGEADVDVTLAAVADAPVVTASSAGGDEDTAIAVTISAGLADADGSETLQDMLISGVPTGATLSAGTNLGDGKWKLTSAQLSGLKVTPAANFSGSLELTVKATTAESSGGGTATTSKTLSVAVAPVDDATTLSAPATLTTSENVAAAVVGVQLADVDAAASGFEVTVSANHGALSLGTATGLTFTTGSAAGGAELVFHGTFAAVNAGLATLSYKGATGYYGADAIAVHAEEFGGGSPVVGEASIAVTVFDVIDPPTLTVANASGLEDSAVPLSITLGAGYTALCGIRIEGVPTGATLSAGTLELDGSWTLTPAQLTGLTLAPPANANGSFDLNVTAFDGAGAALVSTTKTLHVVVSAVNDAPTLSGFGLVESTGEPGALTASNAKVEGTIADVEGKGFFYVELDLDADGKVDQTFSTAPGAFEVDLASLLKAGATTVKARASEYDVATGKTIAGAWQTLTFTYAPVANAAPATTDLALSGTPVETGNVVHAAPLMQGKLTDGALAGAAYFAELDLNGDDVADLMSLAKADGTFSFNLNGLVDLGEQTVRVRGVEVDPQTFEYLYGEWASLKFTLAAEVNALPQISGLALVVDTDTADGVTSDSRITGTLADPDSTGAGYYVEIDLGQDGTVDDTVQVKAGEAFTYDPTSRIAIGDVKLAVRGVEWKGNSDPLRGEWAKFEFEYTGEPTSPPEIVGLALVRDTGTPGDGISFDPRISGTLADATANGYSYTLEVDFDGDGQVDDQMTVQAGTAFVYDPASNASLGSHTYSFRGVERTTVNGVDETATSDWVDFSFTRIAVPVVAPTLTNLHLVNDTDGAGDGLTTDARVAVAVGSTETDGSVYYQIEIDLDGDGYGEQTFEAKPGEVFIFDPASVSLMPGEYTLQMRSTATDYTTNDASGWEEVSFEYVVPVSFDPRVNALRLENDTDLGYDRVTSDPRLTGFAVDGDRMGVSYTLEVDVDGDGDADFSQATTLGADFVVDPTSYIEYGKQSIGVRVVETLQGIGDDLAHAAKVTLSPGAPYTIRAAIGDESLAADQDVFRVDLLEGQTLTLDVDAQSVGGSPAFSGLDSYLKILDAAGFELASNADEQDEYGSPVGSDSKLSFTATADGAYYVVLSADMTWSTSTAGAYYLNLAVDSGSAATSSAILPSVTHKASAWSTVQFTYTPPSAATLPHGAQTDEDAPLTFTGSRAIVVHSVPSGEASVTLTVAHGVLALGGDDSGLASLAGDSSGTVVLSGTIGAINAALASSTFTPDADYFGTANVSLTVQELNPASGLGEQRTSEFDVEVRAINDAPTVSAPAALSTTEDAAVAFDAGHRIVVGDAESATGTLSVTLRAEHGSLHLGQPAAGLSSLQGDGSSTLTLIGTAAQVNASLESLVFTPERDYSGAASVQVIVEDRGNYGAGGPLSAEGTVAVTISDVNDAPRIDAPNSATIDKNERLILEHFKSIVIQDVDSGTHSVSVTLSAANGLLEALGDLYDLDSTTGDGTAVLTLVGTLASVNAALASVRYTPTTDFVGWDAIVVSVDDQGSGVPGAAGAVASESIRVYVDEVWTAPTTDVAPPAAGPTDETIQSQYDASMLALVNASKAAATAAQAILDSALADADSERATGLAAASTALDLALAAAQSTANASNGAAQTQLENALGSLINVLQPYLVDDFSWPAQPEAPTISTNPVEVPSPKGSGPAFDLNSNSDYKNAISGLKIVLSTAQWGIDLIYRNSASSAKHDLDEGLADADQEWNDSYQDVMADYDEAMSAAGEILDALPGVQAHHDSQMNAAAQTRGTAYATAFLERTQEQLEAWGDFWGKVWGGVDAEGDIQAHYDLNVALNKATAKYTKAIADADDVYVRKSIELREDLYIDRGDVDDAHVSAISSAGLQLARDTAEIDKVRGQAKAAAHRTYDEALAEAAHVRDAALVEAQAVFARADVAAQRAAVAKWASAAGAPGSDARNWADLQKNLIEVRAVAILEVTEASRVLALGKVGAAQTRRLDDAESHETQLISASDAAADRDVERAEAADGETQTRLETQATHRQKNAEAQTTRDLALAGSVLTYTKGIADSQLDRDQTLAEASRDYSLRSHRASQQWERDRDDERLAQTNEEDSEAYNRKVAGINRYFRNGALDKGKKLDDAVFSAVGGYREKVGKNNSDRREADVEAIGTHVAGAALADANYAIAVAASIHTENVEKAGHARVEARTAVGLQLVYGTAVDQAAWDATVAAAEEPQFYNDDVWDAWVEQLTPDPEARPSPNAQYLLDRATAARDRVASEGVALTSAATSAAEAEFTRSQAVAAASALMSYSLIDDEYQRIVDLSQAMRDRAIAKASAPLEAAGVLGEGGSGAGGQGGAAAKKFMAAFAPQYWVDAWWTDYIDRWWKRDAIYSDLSKTMAEATRTRARANSDAQYDADIGEITEDRRLERGVEAQNAYDGTYSKAFQKLQSDLAKFDLSTEADGSRERGLRESNGAATRLAAAKAIADADRDWETAVAQAALDYGVGAAEAGRVYSDSSADAQDVADRKLALIAKTQAEALAEAKSEAFIASEKADRDWTLASWERKEEELRDASTSDPELREYQHDYAVAQVAWLTAKNQIDATYASAVATANSTLAQTSAAEVYDLALIQIEAGTTRSKSNSEAAQTRAVAYATETFERIRDDADSTYEYRAGVATLKTTHEVDVQKAEAKLEAAQRAAQLEAAQKRIDAAKTLRDSNHSTEAQNTYNQAVAGANRKAEDDFRKAYKPYIDEIGTAYKDMIVGLGQRDVAWATEIATHQKDMVVDLNSADAIYSAALRSSVATERSTLASEEAEYTTDVADAQLAAAVALVNARNVQLRAMAPRDSGDPTLATDPRQSSEVAGVGPTEAFARAVAAAEVEYQKKKAQADGLGPNPTTFDQKRLAEEGTFFTNMKDAFVDYSAKLAKGEAVLERDQAAAEGKQAIAVATAAHTRTLKLAAAGTELAATQQWLDSVLAVARETADHGLSQASAEADVGSVAATAKAHADYAAAIAKAQVNFDSKFAELQIAADQSGYESKLDALIQKRTEAEGKAVVEQATRLGSAAVTWAKSTTGASTIHSTFVAGADALYALGVKVAADLYAGKAAAAEYEATVAQGDAQATAWVDEAKAAQAQDLAARIAGMDYVLAEAAENALSVESLTNQASDYASSLSQDPTKWNLLQDYNAFRVGLAQDRVEWAAEARSQGAAKAVIAAAARTTYAEAMAGKYRTMVEAEAAAVQSASISIAGATSTESWTIIQAGAADLVAMAPFETDLRVGIAEAEKAYQVKMAKASIAGNDRASLEQAAAEARTETLKRLRDAYARDEQQAALTYAQAVASAQISSIQSWSDIQTTRASDSKAALAAFNQFQFEKATARVETEAAADYSASLDRVVSWTATVQSAAASSNSPYAAQASSNALAKESQSISALDAARARLASAVFADQSAVRDKVSANLEDAYKSVGQEAAWLTGRVQADAERNVQYVRSLGTKIASGEYDPDLLFAIPYASVAALAGQASANLGTGSPSHGWNPGAYVGYYGDWGLYGWYGVGPWNEGATTVSPDGALIGAYSWSYGYGDGYSALLGNWEPWYGDGWYGWVDVAASYGDFNYNQLNSLTARPGPVANATAFGLPADWTDDLASESAQPSETSSSVGAVPVGRGGLLYSMVAAQSAGVVTEGVRTGRIESATMSQPRPEQEDDAIGSASRNVLFQEGWAPVENGGADFLDPRVAVIVMRDLDKFWSGWTRGELIAEFRTQYANDAAALKTLDKLLALNWSIEPAPLAFVRWNVDMQKGEIQISNNYFGYPRSVGNAAAQLYEVLSAKFHQYAGMPESLEYWAWRKGAGATFVVLGQAGQVGGATLVAAPEPLATKVSGVAAIASSTSLKYYGATLFMSRDGGLNMTQAIPGQIGQDLYGPDGRWYFERGAGLAEFGLGLSGLAQMTNTGRSSIWNLRPGFDKDVLALRSSPGWQFAAAGFVSRERDLARLASAAGVDETAFLEQMAYGQELPFATDALGASRGIAGAPWDPLYPAPLGAAPLRTPPLRNLSPVQRATFREIHGEQLPLVQALPGKFGALNEFLKARGIGLITEGDAFLDEYAKVHGWGYLGGALFNADKDALKWVMVLRSNPTRAIVLHELAHARALLIVGPEAFMKASRAQHEVWASGFIINSRAFKSYNAAEQAWENYNFRRYLKILDGESGPVRLLP